MGIVCEFSLLVFTVDMFLHMVAWEQRVFFKEKILQSEDILQNLGGERSWVYLNIKVRSTFSVY